MEAKCAQGGQYEMAKRYNLSIDKQARPSSGAAAPQRRSRLGSGRAPRCSATAPAPGIGRSAAAPQPPRQRARAAL